jgi:hypothetical protein
VAIFVGFSDSVSPDELLAELLKMFRATCSATNKGLSFSCCAIPVVDRLCAAPFRAAVDVSAELPESDSPSSELEKSGRSDLIRFEALATPPDMPAISRSPAESGYYTTSQFTTWIYGKTLTYTLSL